MNSGEVREFNEEWKTVPGFERYHVSNLGNVRLAKGNVTEGHLTPKGYRRVSLYRGKQVKSWFVHSLVLTAFDRPKPPKMECAHLDGNPSNNRLENLKWVTSRENTMHSIEHGTYVHGAKHGCAKLTEEDVAEIKARYKRTSYLESNSRALAEDFGVSQSMIQRIIGGLNWTHRQALGRTKEE